jgi:ABC-type multidrug transport system ATPase subunit
LELLKIHQKVETLISDLGLSQCANTIVGNALLRGISGGERKRTSIGVELLTNPSLIFMDEPTTGLDSATAFNVLEIMKSLAKSGRTVISTIHQPSSEIFGMFDKLLLLVRGELIYQVNFIIIII